MLSYLNVLLNAEDAAKACALRIAEILTEAVAARGEARCALSGGSSPKLMFAELAKLQMNWEKIFLYWVDERVVPPDHPDSNYKMAMEYLILPAGIPIEHLARIAGERYPEEAAAHYISEIRVEFHLKEGELPVFDLIHRGMGPDSHTASLFPGDPLIEDDYEIASNTYVEKFNSNRVTLLPGVLKKARHTVILAPGADKAEALRDVLEGKSDPMKHPCQIAAKPPFPTEWFVDEASARLLTKKS
ncbi:6-phosphogluconolactonase [Bryobacter aggregatus]|uniref:6-phosphogluconolactonase n=1 Tax=Bryobacter aggregatus TaxID=360054 RepID=UPI0004E21480|nr:6-phosphogluconolactonase [Bryobacter aggregatus]